MQAATEEYLGHQEQQSRKELCILNLMQKQNKTDINFVETMKEYAARCDERARKRFNRLFMVPFGRDPSFIGRADITEAISREHERLAMGFHTRVALVGLGGIGKTQIAIDFAFRVRELEPETSIFWIYSNDSTRFIQRYKEISDKVLPSSAEDSKTDMLESLCEWLSDERNGKWLIILDNVDDDNVFFSDGTDPNLLPHGGGVAIQGKPLEFLLPQTPNGCILITSRNSVAAMNLVGTHGSIVTVNEMNEESALALLKTRVPYGDEDENNAKALVYALEYIPLAITHTAAYIKARAPTTTISSYLQLFRKSEVNQLRMLSSTDLKDLRRDYSTRYAVLVTWQISFNQVRTSWPAAADLLAFSSMFDRHSIPLSLLRRNLDETDFNDALQRLQTFSLIRPNVGDQSFDMHRLVQLSMRKWLEARKQLERWQKESVNAFLEVLPLDSEDYNTWSSTQMLVPHSKELVSHRLNDPDIVLDQAEIAERTSWYLHARGQDVAAELFGRTMLIMRETVLGMEDSDTLASAGLLGMILENLGKHEEAIALHLRELSGYQDPKEMLLRVSNLSIALSSLGRENEAESLMRQSVSGLEKVLGPDHPDTLSIVTDLALALDVQGKYGEAESLHQRVLEVRQREFGPNNEDTLRTLNHLGVALIGQEKYKEAEKWLRQAVKAFERLPTQESYIALTSIKNLGYALQGQGKYEEAEVMMRRSFQGFEKTMGLENMDTIKQAGDLGRVLLDQGKYQAGRAMYAQALEGAKKLVGEEDPSTLEIMADYASALSEQGYLVEAEELEVKVLETRKRVLGEEDCATLESMANYAETLNRSARYDEAMFLMEECFYFRERKLGFEHQDTAFSFKCLREWTSQDYHNVDFWSGIQADATRFLPIQNWKPEQNSLNAVPGF